MIGLLSPQIVTADPVIIRRVERMRHIACCAAAGCGRLATSPDARLCTRTDCGLADRHFHEELDKCQAA